MTYEQREAIFAKETITTEELAQLCGGISRSAASNLMTRIKTRVGDSFEIRGRVAVADYLRFLDVQGEELVRYRQKNLDKVMERAAAGLPRQIKAQKLGENRPYQSVFIEKGRPQEGDDEQPPKRLRKPKRPGFDKMAWEPKTPDEQEMFDLVRRRFG